MSHQVITTTRDTRRDCPTCRHDCAAGCKSPDLNLMTPAEKDAFWRAPGECQLWEQQQ